MAKGLVSKIYQMDDFASAMEFFQENHWTDGLPIVPPTENRVRDFLDYAGLEPDQVIGVIPERASAITAEKLAINAVMAGCLPEYMPVLVAVVEAMTDPQFKFNHLASIGSPWPLIIVNGPIVKQVGFNSGMYLFGPGSRPNATTARAISLVMANCAEARPGGVQRGQLGHPGRWCGCVAENEDTAWVPLHVQRGFDRNTSAVTVVSTYPGFPYPVRTMVVRPERMLDSVCHGITNFGGALWARATYTVVVGPHQAEVFIREGWSKEDVRNYIFDNTRASIADLKYRGIWGGWMENFTEADQEIHPGDESKFLYLFKDNGEYERYMFAKTILEGRTLDLFVIVASGDAGSRIGLAVPYQASTNPVSKAIKTSRGPSAGQFNNSRVPNR